VHAFCTFQLFSLFCSSFWQNVGSFSTFGLTAIFGYFCSFLGLYELVQAKKVYCRFSDVLRYSGSLLYCNTRFPRLVILCLRSHTNSSGTYRGWPYTDSFDMPDAEITQHTNKLDSYGQPFSGVVIEIPSLEQTDDAP
jgi:hypothetical protein